MQLEMIKLQWDMMLVGIITDFRMLISGVIIGYNMTGNYSTVVGPLAGWSSTGRFNCFHGNRSGRSRIGAFNTYSGNNSGNEARGDYIILVTDTCVDIK